MIDDTKSFFYNYLHVVIGNTIGSGVVQFVSLLLLVRILEPERYGSYVLFITVASIISVLTIWTSGSMVRFGREEFITEGSVRKTFWANYWILAPAFVLCLLLIFIFRAKLSQYVGIPQEYCYLIFAYILLSNLSSTIPTAFQAMGKMKRFSYLPLAFSVSFLIALAAIYLKSLPVSVELVIVLLLLSHLLATIIGLWLVRKDIIPICFPRDWIKKCFSYSWPMAFGGVSGEVVRNVDQAVIRMFMALAFVGVYNVAYILQNYLLMLPMLSMRLIFPLMTTLIVTKEEAKIGQYIKLYAPQIAFVWALVLTLFMTFAPEIFLLFGSDYAAAAFPFSILLLCIAIRIFPTIESPVLSSYGLIKEAASISVAIGAINLGLDFLLIPRMGISGAAVATLVAFACGTVVRTFVIKKKLEINNFISYPWLFPIIAVFISSVFIDSWVPRALVLLAVIVVSLLIAKRSAVFNSESLFILDSIDMPPFLRRTIKRVYSFVI